MERVEPERAVIVVWRVLREAATEFGDAGLAFVKNRATEDRQAFDVEHDFGEPLGCLEEFIGLEAANRGESVIRIPLRYREDVVWLRIELKLTLEKILENELVA